MRLAELVCNLAREAAVGASYRANLADGPVVGAVPEPDAWEVLASIREESDALRVSPLR
jgi:hypothetical protein